MKKTKFTSILGLAVLLHTAPLVQAQSDYLQIPERWDYEYLTDSKIMRRNDIPVGPFERLDSKTILSAKSNADGNSIYISKNNGQNWELLKVLSGNDVKLSSAEVIASKNGTIVLGFCSGPEQKWTWDSEINDAPGAIYPTYVVRSTDHGKTWEKPQKLHDDWTGYNTNMIVTSKGYFVFTSMVMLNNPGRHAVITYTSKDDGKTWTRSNILDFGGIGHHDGSMEATIVELKNGNLMKLIRTNWDQFWRAESKDDGLTWHVLGPSGIPASAAHGKLLRLSSGRLLLAWNRPYPDGETEPRNVVGGDNIWSAVPGSNYRNELSIAFSNDDGKTWSKPVIAAKTEDAQMRSNPREGMARRYVPVNEVCYPFLFEYAPGEVWITTSRGPLRASFKESDLIR